MVYRTARRVTGSPEDAEDVLQTVFVQLVRLPAGSWPENPRAYVHRAAVNAALDIVRRRKRRPEADLSDELAATTTAAPGRDEEGHAVGQLDRDRLAARLRRALTELSPLEAEVFWLRFFEDQTNSEIADAIGKTPNHVGVTLHSARRKLREALGETVRHEAETGGDDR